MTVYLDLLVIINFAFNFILLTITGWMALKPYSHGRYGIAALVGTIFWFIYFISPKYISINWLCRVAGGLAMTLIAWRPVRLQGLISKSLLLVVAGQLVGGGIYSLLFLLESAPFGTPGGVPLAVVAAGVVLALLVAAWWAGRIQRTQALAAYVGQVSILWDGKEVSVTALLDSGNTLRHPVNSWPVVIVERDVAINLLGAEILNWLDHPITVPPRVIEARVALIPFTSLGARGLLAAVRPDRLVISRGQHRVTLTQVYMAPRQKMQPPLEYPALAFPIELRKDVAGQCEKLG